MTRLEQLRAIIDVALQAPGKSKLTEECFSVGGFTSPNIRHLLNNLAAISKNYFEVGSHVGASLVSAAYGNKLESATGCDNFSLFSTDEHNSRDEFYKNADRVIPGKYKLLEKDCWTIRTNELPPIDLYFFDGAHDYESQKKGVTYFAPFLTDEAIVAVDDFMWPEPNEGTMDGFFEAGLKIKWMCTLDSGMRSDCGDRGWWNGLGIFLIKK